MERLNSSPKKIRVLVVDDSAFMRYVISDIIAQDHECEVIGTAHDPYIARDKIKSLNPDVITLDINMPRMDGLSFLEKIMTLRPMPVVMISSLTEKGAKETLEALQLGAVDYIAKPTDDFEKSFRKLSDEICLKVKTAASTKVKARHASKSYTSSALTVDLAKAQQIPLVAIGASTGGVEALTEIFTLLPETCPPILVVQHMPANFTTSFAARLDKICKPKVYEAHDRQLIERGSIYIAPGDYHMEVRKFKGELRVQLSQTPNVSGHRPSVDVLFASVATSEIRSSLGVILTGMGRDGAEGLKKLRDFGAKTYGQNEDSALVYGMPRAAKELGATEKEVPLKNIASIIMGSDILS